MHTQPPVQLVTGVLSPGVKQQEREADHSPPSSSEVRNMWSYTSTNPYLLMAWYSVWHRGFTFCRPIILPFFSKTWQMQNISCVVDVSPRPIGRWRPGRPLRMDTTVRSNFVTRRRGHKLGYSAIVAGVDSISCRGQRMRGAILPLP
jgi:hypothetical protein